eukprot:CAMPEP_0184510418 /NCGR_PEP_ID=MMETSP0198_2-20121128/1802_1 /TAXON_ID=1112570 /ORGANISM="Thraustochytrium sp., Strain LLF1b" /LENGTH=382 /DNA_ID=CAMNT_0026900305 /DNA_START=141 /DNA_END=1289 /DNA_ORIENTATION=-
MASEFATGNKGVHKSGMVPLEVPALLAASLFFVVGISQDGAIVTLGALLGPVLLLWATNIVMEMAEYEEWARFVLARKKYVHVTIFAGAAAGTANVLFAGADLIVLNTLGAAVNGVLMVVDRLQGGQIDTEAATALDTFELFRNVFCGVLTSFVGVIFISATSTLGFKYYLLSVAAGVVATELGMRLGGEINDLITSRGRGGAWLLTRASVWLTYGSAYVSLVALLRSAVADWPQLLTSYAFSAAGSMFGDLLDIWPDGLRQDLVSNVAAVIMALLFAKSCKSKPSLVLCNTVLHGEWEGSFCGAVSTFCGTSFAAHGLVRGLIDEHRASDVYLDTKLPGSRALRRFKDLEDSDETKQGIIPHALRVLADATLVAAVMLVLA